jgi:putative isomerase
MTSVLHDDPRFDSADYWRGPCRLVTTCFAATALRRYGFAETAQRLRETILHWCAATTDSLYEYSDSLTGRGLGAPGYGWTAAFVIEFILDW